MNKTDYTLTGLNPGDDSTIVIEAYNDFSQEFTNEMKFSTIDPIDSPKNLNLVKAKGSSIEISWSQVNSASGYKIYKNGKWNKTLTSSELSTELNYLTPATSYDIEIEAFNETTTSDKTYGSFNSGLKTPENLRSFDLSFDSFKVTCNSVDGASEYEFYEPHGYGDTYLGSITNLNEGLLIKDLYSNSVYPIIVLAKKGSVKSEKSGSILVNTKEEVKLYIPDSVRTEYISNYSGIDDDQYRIYWQKVDGADYYEVKSLNTNNYERIERTSGSENEIVLERDYYYGSTMQMGYVIYVRACKNSGQKSEFSYPIDL